MTKITNADPGRTILIVGGGISGITAAVEAAEVGYDVLLAEREPYLGGRVARMNQYFPKLCAPGCGLEINFKRIKTNPRVKVLTQATVEGIAGQEKAYDVTLKISPATVNDNCTACGKCAEVCPVERPNDFNYGLDKTKAIYISHPMAFPMKFAIDAKACLGAQCSKCVSACPYGAIDLGKTEQKVDVKVGAIILTTGWKPYDATKLDNLGFGKYPNVITNTMLERLAAADGPTHGWIVRPSDGEQPKNIAFVQCAGSRDENHLPYCSAVCCLGSLKQITYIREKIPAAKVSVYYIDIRAPGSLEDFYRRVQGYDNVSLIKGKVAKIEEDPQTRNLTIHAEEIAKGQIATQTVDMVVLATGIVPTAVEGKMPQVAYDNYGFIASGPSGIYAAGCSTRPADVSTSVQDATGAALKAIQSIVRGN